MLFDFSVMENVGVFGSKNKNITAFTNIRENQILVHQNGHNHRTSLEYGEHQQQPIYQVLLVSNNLLFNSQKIESVPNLILIEP